MYNIFCMENRRKVTNANFNHYKNGLLHPDRILNEHDIFYMLEGNWEVGQNGTNYQLEQGDVIILQAKQHHYGISKCSPGTRTMFVHFECLPNDDFRAEADETPQTGAMLSLPVVIKCGDNISITKIFEEIISSFWSHVPNKNIKLAALIDLLLFELAVQSRKSPDMYDSLVYEAIRYIQLYHNKILSLSELSKLLNICSRSLTNRFKMITGKTIHRYQIEMKLEMAYLSLKDNPNQTLKEVAANFGFYDEFHFSRLFKKKYGFAPSKMKKAWVNFQ